RVPVLVDGGFDGRPVQPGQAVRAGRFGGVHGPSVGRPLPPRIRAIAAKLRRQAQPQRRAVITSPASRMTLSRVGLYSIVMTWPGRMTRRWADCERSRASLPTASEYFWPTRSCARWASHSDMGAPAGEEAPAAPSGVARWVPLEAQAARLATRKTGISLRIMKAPSGSNERS